MAAESGSTTENGKDDQDESVNDAPEAAFAQDEQTAKEEEEESGTINDPLTSTKVKAPQRPFRARTP